MASIIVADDNKAFREALVMYLENELNHWVMGEDENGEELLHDIKINKADILLVDIEMPILNGIESVKQILNNYHDIKAIAITGYQEKAYLKDLISSGFKGCVYKDSIYDLLGVAISTVISGSYYFPDDIKLENK